ncbi:MAG: AFG1/ZapE family ATPase [Candidatus Acidiferrales bacterium]
MRISDEEPVDSLKTRGVPPRYRECRLQNFSAYTDGLAKKLEQIKHLAKEARPRGLYLFGPPGAGKTHLAVAVMAELLSRGFNGEFAQAMCYSLRVQRAYGDPTEIVADMLHEAHFIVLDDIGAERSSESARVALLSLIDELYTRKRCLIATSNLRPADLEKFEPRAMSRIAEMCLLVEVNAADYRVKLATERQTAEQNAGRVTVN